MSLYDAHGHRKYLTPTERQEFLSATESGLQTIATFCGTLTYAGCRISEALALTADRVDLGEGVLIFESLKKRRRGIYRGVPIPPEFLIRLDAVHQVALLQRRPDGGRGVYLWPWSRTTGWRFVHSMMRQAGIEGSHATPKGLRHAFGIKASVSQVPLNMTQKWMGHSKISTTAIYSNAIGPEEKKIAERMWTT